MEMFHQRSSLKTVHRTVFLTLTFESFCSILKKTKNRPIWSVLNFGRGRRTQIRFLADLHCLTTQILWISVPVFAPFRYKTVIYTVLLNAQSPLRVRVLYIFTIKRKHPPKWWMFLSMAGAEYVAVLENANFACWVHVLWKCFINAVR